MSDGSLLNRYWDDLDTPRDESYREDAELGRANPRSAAALYRNIRAGAESGWDFGSRWFADGRSRVDRGGGLASKVGAAPELPAGAGRGHQVEVDHLN